MPKLWKSYWKYDIMIMRIRKTDYYAKEKYMFVSSDPTDPDYIHRPWLYSPTLIISTDPDYIHLNMSTDPKYIHRP
jgi:hypothetical protein